MAGMDAETAAREFAAVFPEVYRRFCRRMHRGEYQLTNESYGVLQHLADTGPLTVTEAAKHFGRSQSATSELIDRLVQRGLLERLADERDRRRTLIWLTDAGSQQLADARSVLSQELLQCAMGQLSENKRKRLIESMNSLVNTKPVCKDDCDE